MLNVSLVKEGRMAYKIAIGSSDEVNVQTFLIYDVWGTKYRLAERREVVEDTKADEGVKSEASAKTCSYGETDNLSTIDKRSSNEQCGAYGESTGSCGISGSHGACGGSSTGCGGSGSGCLGPTEVVSKVALIADCRCVVCKKVGFQAQKQFEKKAISVFDVECTIEEALDKITSYYAKVGRL
jgi:hypothetical protein